MEKMDLKKSLAEYYSVRKGQVVLVDVPDFGFLMIDGEGDPNTSQQYREAVEALYGLAYTIKFRVKKGPLQRDYGVMPLEGQWWSNNMDDFTAGNKENWKWTMAIMQPDLVTASLVDECRREAGKKKALPALERIRFERFHEGLSAQILHIGPYAEEAPTIERLHAHIAGQGYQRRGKHREIYLGDPRRTAPERLRTIIRQPVSHS